ncbi:DUF6895 family protein [Streptomyces flavofungini]|uniref:DUF6895 domain-containing protein n=1 Tax=Streptomyces flavofungini TaxID=68200 RepID=A0ABS0X7Q4_9ACTN|nr:hypothetical protein [Streptomyces flavofungini]MBJ3809026.1 hypothetical protein [Streptomyces flavofungini]GHC68192.1 hypothetical protein GCM10010349_41950 [Streptomyces flavofungini]
MTASVTRTAHQVSARALTWLHTHRERGALPADTTADLGDPDSVYKPLGESALAASLVLREAAAGGTELRLARELMDFCWRQFGDGDMLYERLLRYSMMTDPLETYAPFARCGIRHEPLDRLLAHTSGLRSVRGAEVLPNRRLAVANAARVAGLDQGAHAYDWSALARATWLGAVPEPWLIDWMTGYCLTHTVFHLTDWGADPTGLPADLAAYVTTWLPVWIDIWAEIEQWDLVAELMIVGCCLPEPYCAPADWERLARAQHPDGLVPRDGDPVADDPGRRFEDHQHTAVVAAIAGTLAVSRTLGGAAGQR